MRLPVRSGRALGALLVAAIAALAFTPSALAAPTVTITSIPGGYTNNTLPSLAFSVTAGAPECSLSGSEWSACASPFVPASSLADGTYTLLVRAFDGAGWGSASSSFTVDTVMPGLVINAPIPGQVFDSSSLDINLSVSGGTAECNFDGAAFVACSTRFIDSPLLDGPHRLCVRATDMAGNSKLVCVVFSIGDSLGALRAEALPPVELELSVSRGGAVKRGRYSVPVNISILPATGAMTAKTCVGSVSISIRPRVRRAKVKAKRARMHRSGRRCVAGARISLPRKYKGEKATIRVHFNGSSALGSFSYANTVKQL